jgi:hypothetical protein
VHSWRCHRTGRASPQAGRDFDNAGERKEEPPQAISKPCFSVILNGVKDVNLLKILDRFAPNDHAPTQLGFVRVYRVLRAAQPMCRVILVRVQVLNLLAGGRRRAPEPDSWLCRNILNNQQNLGRWRPGAMLPAGRAPGKVIDKKQSKKIVIANWSHYISGGKEWLNLFR